MQLGLGALMFLFSLCVSCLPLIWLCGARGCVFAMRNANDVISAVLTVSGGPWSEVLCFILCRFDCSCDGVFLFAVMSTRVRYLSVYSILYSDGV